MKTILWLLVIFVWACSPPAGEEMATPENAGAATVEQTDNTLTPKEKEAGWVLLFDGESLDEWMTDTGEPQPATYRRGQY